MKYIPGHKFVSKRRVTEPFVIGNTYKIHLINKKDDGFEYVFASNNGGLVINFKSTSIADSIIEKTSS